MTSPVKMSDKSGSRKRKLVYNDVHLIDEEVQFGATVHGQLMGLSPVKSSKRNDSVKYFDGHLSDGKEICRIVSFAPKVRAEMEGFMEKGQSVSLVNCGIKRSKMESFNGPLYDIHISEKTSIVSSPIKFDVGDEVRGKIIGNVVELEKMEMIGNIVANSGNKVAIKGKVISINDTVEIKSNDKVFTKRECVFANSKGYRLVLWEDMVNSVECGKF